MKKIRQIRKLKKSWKSVIMMLAALIIISGGIVYINAATSVNMHLSISDMTMTAGTSERITATLTGSDDNTANGKPSPDNVTWSSSNENIIKCIREGGSGDTASAIIKSEQGFAGKVEIRAAYNSIVYDNTGSVISSDVVAESVANILVPLSVTTSDSKGSSDVSNTLYEVGDTITFTANTNQYNRVVIETKNDSSGTLSSDGVIELASSTANTATVKVIGGGKTEVTVRTEDAQNNVNLIKHYTVRSKVEFDTTRDNSAGHRIKISPVNGEKYMVLDETDYVDFTYEEIPSNITYPETSGVDFRSSDTDKVAISKGRVCGVHAGISDIIAGLPTLDANGNETWYTKDNVRIITPFKKMGNLVENMNVGNQLQLSTSANTSEITWTTSDNTVLKVDENGLVTAVSAGTAKIYATRVQDELYTVYGQPMQLVYEIKVIDDFALSLTSTTVNIGETVNIQALVTEQDIEKNPLSYVVTNQPKADGSVPTGNLISVEVDGKNFKITGVQSGIAQIKVTQSVNGVMKSATCVVYVTTPVGEVSINPSSIKIDRGQSDTVQLLFNPAGPTNDKVLWSSSNPNVATVEGDSYTATIKGIKGGTATISVVSEDGLKSATCDVYVREPVTGLTLNANTVESTMSVGKYQLVATVAPEGDGVDRNVTWTSTDESVITVDENGLVTFVKPGHAAVVCKTEDGAFISSCNFIIDINVETVKLDHIDEIMRINDTLKISAEVLPLEASNRVVSWESSNPNVAMVDSNGLVTAVGTGSCTILCQSLDGHASAMCNIYVKQPVEQVVLNVSDISVRKGQVFWLGATCLPENADNKIIKWTSRDENVCTVDENGKVTAVGIGTTSIIATNEDSGITAFCVVTVTQPITGIKLNSDYQQLWVGAKYAIIPVIEPYDAENKRVTYLSSDPEVASVDENGIVTAIKGGNCVITVTTEEYSLTAACTIDVKEYVSSIDLTNSFEFLNIGQSLTIGASVGGPTATNKSVVWSSGDDTICSVDQNGTVTANNPGVVVITATAADGSGVTASCVIQVVNPVTDITIVPDTVHLLVGDSQSVSAVITPDDATIQDVDWETSNENVAIVDESGEIFAIGTGKCKITATSRDGNNIKGVCWVYVTPNINITSLKINSKEIYMLSGKSRQLSVRVRPINNTDSYDWYSTDTGIVVVDDGLITTVGPGTAEVVVESNNGTASSSCIVHSLAMSRSSITLEQYDSYWLDVLGLDNNEKVTWRSNNPRVCTVSSTGQVIGRKAGTTTVTAFVKDKTLTCTVKVTNIW